MNHRTPPSIAFALAACLAIAGCTRRHVAEQQGPHPRWPGGSEPERIRHVRDIRGPEDIGKTAFFQSLGRLVTGEKQQGLLQPNSVAVAGDLVAITDQERQGVHVLAFASGRSDFLSRMGELYFVSPVGIAWCDGEVAVADSALKKVAILSTRGKLRRTLDQPFERPTGLAYDPLHRELYVVDTLAHRVHVFDLAQAQAAPVRTIGGQGTDVGQMNFPTHVFVDRHRQVYVTDSLNFRVQVFNHLGEYQFEIGRHGDATGHMGIPKGVATDTFGHIYVVDSYFSTVQIFDRQGRFLLNFGRPGTKWGEFQVPGGLTIDGNNRIYVCDAFNHRVQVFEYVGGPDDETSNDETHAAEAQPGTDR